MSDNVTDMLNQVLNSLDETAEERRQRSINLAEQARREAGFTSSNIQVYSDGTFGGSMRNTYSNLKVQDNTFWMKLQAYGMHKFLADIESHENIIALTFYPGASYLRVHTQGPMTNAIVDWIESRVYSLCRWGEDWSPELVNASADLTPIPAFKSETEECIYVQLDGNLIKIPRTLLYSIQTSPPLRDHQRNALNLEED